MPPTGFSSPFVFLTSLRRRRLEERRDVRNRLSALRVLSGPPLAFALLSLAGVARAEPDGATLFAQNCAACHQKSGLGIKGAYPALAGDKLAQGAPDVLAKTVLYGRAGMPAFAADLDDPTLAKILTYVRSSWGNKASPITPAVLAHMRLANAPKKADVTMGAH